MPSTTARQSETTSTGGLLSSAARVAAISSARNAACWPGSTWPTSVHPACGPASTAPRCSSSVAPGGHQRARAPPLSLGSAGWMPPPIREDDPRDGPRADGPARGGLSRRGAPRAKGWAGGGDRPGPERRGRVPARPQLAKAAPSRARPRVPRAAPGLVPEGVAGPGWLAKVAKLLKGMGRGWRPLAGRRAQPRMRARRRSLDTGRGNLAARLGGRIWVVQAGAQHSGGTHMV